MKSDANFYYRLYDGNSSKDFKIACRLIESKFSGLEKNNLVMDVDGSVIQIYLHGLDRIVVNNDCFVGAIYVESDERLDFLEEENN